MKKSILTIFASALFLFSCTSSEKLMLSGNYDGAIHHAVKKLKKKRTNQKEVGVLEESFRKAVDRDNESVNRLKVDGSPENWEKILAIYRTMSSRQEVIKPVLPLQYGNRTAQFNMVNYDQEMTSSKEKAAEFSYTYATQLMQKTDKESNRKAYYELQKVKNYYTTYKDVDTKMEAAKKAGTSFVIVKLENKTGTPLPPKFEEELFKFNAAELNKDWVKYEMTAEKYKFYDYTVLVNIQSINVTPDATKEILYSESKEIQDGTDYVLDAKGNVKKDSLGNDIKVPKFKTVICAVTETYQSKSANVTASLDYIDSSTGKSIKSDPLVADALFENRAAIAIGDYRALKPETEAKTKKSKVAFPTTNDMLMQAEQLMHASVKDLIMVKNKDVIK